jgi:hypothetical protein
LERSPSVRFLHAAGLVQHSGSVIAAVEYLRTLQALGVLS